MKTTLYIVSWVSLVLGILAVLGSISEPTDGIYGVIGGGMYAIQGFIALAYLKSEEK